MCGMKKVFLSMLFAAGALCACAAEFEPAWESLETRSVPEWYENAKFGIFCHWGIQCAAEDGDEVPDRAGASASMMSHLLDRQLTRGRLLRPGFWLQPAEPCDRLKLHGGELAGDPLTGDIDEPVLAA
jgi:hypothetical protein